MNVCPSSLKLLGEHQSLPRLDWRCDSWSVAWFLWPAVCNWPFFDCKPWTQTLCKAPQRDLKVTVWENQYSTSQAKNRNQIITKIMMSRMSFCSKNIIFNLKPSGQRCVLHYLTFVWQKRDFGAADIMILSISITSRTISSSRIKGAASANHFQTFMLSYRWVFMSLNFTTTMMNIWSVRRSLWRGGQRLVKTEAEVTSIKLEGRTWWPNSGASHTLPSAAEEEDLVALEAFTVSPVCTSTRVEILQILFFFFFCFREGVVFETVVIKLWVCVTNLSLPDESGLPEVFRSMVSASSQRTDGC